MQEAVWKRCVQCNQQEDTQLPNTLSVENCVFWGLSSVKESIKLRWCALWMAQNHLHPLWQRLPQILFYIKFCFNIDGRL